MNIGLAMYTVHKHAEENLHETLLKAAAMGYQGIEFYGGMLRAPEDIRTAVKDSGLIFTGWHTEWRDLQEDRIDRTIEYLHKSGCPAAVIPCLGGKWNIGHTSKEECREIWLSYFSSILKIRDRLAQNGIRCGYHNHEHEFQICYDKKALFEFIFDSLPEDIIVEFDSGNCIEGGGDPFRILQKYHSRDMILHMKPYSFAQGFDTVLGNPDDANDWRRILDLIRDKDMWVLVESENTKLEEYENAARCLDNFRTIMAGLSSGNDRE